MTAAQKVNRTERVVSWIIGNPGFNNWGFCVKDDGSAIIIFHEKGIGKGIATLNQGEEYHITPRSIRFIGPKTDFNRFLRCLLLIEETANKS